VATAITNAFESYRYREMALIHTGVLDYTIHGRKFEGGYDLTCMSLLGAITNVVFDNGRVLPYFASFYVETEPVSENRTKVTVRTISSGVSRWSRDWCAWGRGGPRQEYCTAPAGGGERSYTDFSLP